MASTTGIPGWPIDLVPRNAACPTGVMVQQGAILGRSSLSTEAALPIFTFTQLDATYGFADFPGMIVSIKNAANAINNEVLALTPDDQAYEPWQLYKQSLGLPPDHSFNQVFYTVFTYATNNDPRGPLPQRVMLNWSCGSLTYTNPNENSVASIYIVPSGIVQEIQLYPSSYGVYSGYVDLDNNSKFYYCMIPKINGDCRINTIDQPMPDNCTIIPSTNSESDDCYDWFQTQSQRTQNALIQSVCNAFPEFQECNCVKRQTRPQYEYVSLSPEIGDVGDGCWWKPCKLGSRSTWRTSSDRIQLATCVPNFCLTLENYDNLTQDEKDGLDQFITCVKQAPPGSDFIAANESSGVIPDSTIIIGSLAGIFVLGLILSIVLVYGRAKGWKV